MNAPPDFRDWVVEDLAYSEAVLREQVAHWAERAVRAEHDRETYRLLAVEAIHQAHGFIRERQKLEDRNDRLVGELRELRACCRSTHDGGRRAA